MSRSSQFSNNWKREMRAFGDHLTMLCRLKALQGGDRILDGITMWCYEDASATVVHSCPTAEGPEGYPPSRVWQIGQQPSVVPRGLCIIVCTANMPPPSLSQPGGWKSLQQLLQSDLLCSGEWALSTRLNFSCRNKFSCVVVVPPKREPAWLYNYITDRWKC